jgi:hypothetical protein
MSQVPPQDRPTLTPVEAQPPPYVPPIGPPTGQGSKWPIVIGWVSIGVGAFFAAMALLGLANPAAWLTPARARQYQFSPPDWLKTWQVAASLLSLATYGTLILAGALLLKRRPAARPLHLLYVALAVFLAATVMVLQVHMAEYMSTSLNVPMPRGMRPLMKSMVIFGMVLGLPMTLGYPTFLVIWLLRGKVVREIKTWGAR